MRLRAPRRHRRRRRTACTPERRLENSRIRVKLIAGLSEAAGGIPAYRMRTDRFHSADVITLHARVAHFAHCSVRLFYVAKRGRKLMATGGATPKALRYGSFWDYFGGGLEYLDTVEFICIHERALCAVITFCHECKRTGEAGGAFACTYSRSVRLAFFIISAERFNRITKKSSLEHATNGGAQGGFPGGYDLLAKLVLIVLARGGINYSAADESRHFCFNFIPRTSVLSRVRESSRVAAHYCIARIISRLIIIRRVIRREKH